jgi:hypothetical protein
MKILELQAKKVGTILSTNKVDAESRTSKLLRDLYIGLVAADEERLAMLQEVILNQAVQESLEAMLFNVIRPTVCFPKIDCEDPVLETLTETNTEIRLDLEDWYLINPVVSEPEYTGEII